MAVGLTGCDALLRLINTPAEIMADSALYLDIYILGLPFMFFYNVATGIFSALGDSRTPFLFLAASSIANIALDVVFVTAFQMGVAGVAWATFLCQGVSCVLAVLALLRRLKTIPAQNAHRWFSGEILRVEGDILSFPAALEGSTEGSADVLSGPAAEHLVPVFAAVDELARRNLFAEHLISLLLFSASNPPVPAV